MVRISEAIDSDEIRHSIPLFHINNSSTDDTGCIQALNKHINHTLEVSNTKEAGLLLYNLPDTLDSRVLVSESGNVYIVICNPWRKLKRIACSATKVAQPFDDASFHFLKADIKECIAWLRIGEGRASAAAADPMKDTLLLINNAPMTRSHFLVVPHPAARLPQVLTPYSVRTAIELCRGLAADGDSNLLLGFNSICAFASVNHLHLHAYRLALAPDQQRNLKEANSGCIPALHRPLVPLHWTRDFPVSVVTGQLPGLRVDSLTTEAAVNVLLAVIETVQSHDCAHNVLFFCDGSGDVSAIVYCRAKAVGVKDAGAVNVALSELSGHVFAKDLGAFERYSGDELDALFEQIRLPCDVYRVICDAIIERVLQLLGPEDGESQLPGDSQATVSATSLTPSQLVETIAQLKALRSQLQAEMDVLKSQIGGMQSASAEARAALEQAAEDNAQHQSSLKSCILQPEPDFVIASSTSINYALFAIIVVFLAILCHKHLGPLMF